uniref:Uncharacterized protein n=1 Tax=Anguilla anguilla TaxID=7936 RepID=A0A0E9SN37_ANGAN
MGICTQLKWKLKFHK